MRPLMLIRVVIIESVKENQVCSLNLEPDTESLLLYAAQELV